MIKFNIKDALSEFKRLGGTTSFPESLKQVLNYMQKDKNLSTIKEAAWLLATAKAESDYSLQRWESDYKCGKGGVPYKTQPCERALTYYRSTDNKKNYYDLGTDKNGMPYFGRGLIQLTGKKNYKTYGDIIGVDLIGDGDKALEPKNSYNIASSYFKKRKVFQYANDENFPMARQSVKGSDEGWEKVKKTYDLWIDVFSKRSVNFKVNKNTQKIINTILYSVLGLSVIALAYGVYRVTREK